MTVALIAPRRNNRSARRRRFGTGFFRVPPLGLLNVAAATPEDVEVRLVDENVEPVSYADPPDLVGISVMTASADRAYEIADRYRELGVPVVLGGSHVSAMADEALEHADSVVIGEAEGAWDVLIEDSFAGFGTQPDSGMLRRIPDAVAKTFERMPGKPPVDHFCCDVFVYVPVGDESRSVGQIAPSGLHCEVARVEQVVHPLRVYGIGGIARGVHFNELRGIRLDGMPVIFGIRFGLILWIERGQFRI